MTWSPESVNFGIVVALLSGFVSGVFAPIPIPFKSKRPFGPQQFGYLKKAAPHNGVPRSINCPYDYLLNIYGQHHFEPFVQWFKPSLEQDDPQKYSLILDIMDAVHFCLILVDDISDDSSQRKSQPTAHTLYGASETANRAYFVLTQVINRALREHPVLGVELMKALEDILHGQDKSLIWRRDGLSSFPTKSNERIAAYKEMAQLKTGTLFKLLGRLLNDGSTELDDVLIRFGWFAQLQNDCKDIYSAEYNQNKGAIAEDLRNGELSFPVVVALNNASCTSIVAMALESHDDEDIHAALSALRSDHVRGVCLEAMKEAGQGMESLVALWGRRERMQATGPV